MLLMIFLIASVNAKYEMTVAEMNLLYQFDDLVSDQFAYQEEKNFDFLTRLKNNVASMNHITKGADFVCFLEWNGNKLSPFYLDTVAELKKLGNKDELEDDWPECFENELNKLQDIEKLIPCLENKETLEQTTKKSDVIKLNVVINQKRNLRNELRLQ